MYTYKQELTDAKTVRNLDMLEKEWAVDYGSMTRAQDEIEEWYRKIGKDIEWILEETVNTYVSTRAYLRDYYTWLVKDAKIHSRCVDVSL